MNELNGQDGLLFGPVVEEIREIRKDHWNESGCDLRRYVQQAEEAVKRLRRSEHPGESEAA